MKKLVFIFACLCITLFAASAADIDVIETRMIESYIESGGDGAYLSTQQGDGSWTDIDYTSTHETSWSPLQHVERLKQMAIAYNDSEDPHYNDAAMLTGLKMGLDYWYNHTPTSTNWWFNDIGQQQNLGPVLLLLKGETSEYLTSTGLAFLKDPSMTALNLVDISEQTVLRGLVSDNVSDVQLGLDAIKSTVLIAPGIEDGIKADYSFHQHQSQLYDGGYGLEYVAAITRWFYITRGLDLGLGDDGIGTYSDYLLDGMQWMVWKSNFDFSVVGRGLTRQNKLTQTSAIAEALSTMALIGDGKSGEYNSFEAHIGGGVNPLIGDKHFWKSDYHSHRRDDYFVSVRMASTRTTASESMNGENPLGLYLPYGATCINVDGGEYYNIFPVWDWCRIPGTTSPLKATPGAMPDWWANYGATSFVGGVSDGSYGVSVLDLEVDAVYGKKAWFLFDEEIVALGAGINSAGGDNIVTSVNQSLLDGDVTVNDGSSSVYSAGNRTLTDPDWVFHDKVLYIFPESHDVVLKNESQSGSWSDINSMYTYESVSSDVFSLWIDHGVNPTAASYNYTIVPAVNLGDVATYISGSSNTVLSNTTSLQAIRNNNLGVTGIVFHQAGNIDVSGDINIAVDEPCVVLLNEANNSLSISNPNQTDIDINVSITHLDSPPAGTDYAFEAGEYLGRSIASSEPVLSGEFVISANGSSGLPNLINGNTYTYKVSIVGNYVSVANCDFQNGLSVSGENVSVSGSTLTSANGPVLIVDRAPYFSFTSNTITGSGEIINYLEPSNYYGKKGVVINNNNYLGVTGGLFNGENWGAWINGFNFDINSTFD